MICTNCAAACVDGAKFCNECGAALTAEKNGKTATRIADPRELARTIVSRTGVLQRKRQADIMFVLDCTGSMGGEINAIKDTFCEFADTIASDGVRARVGVTAFRDRLINEEHEVLRFDDGAVFTSNPQAFRRAVSHLEAHGGGDRPESSADAIVEACRHFSSDAERVLGLVTDAPPHFPDRDTATVEAVKEAMKKAGITQMYLIIRTQDPDSQVYLRLLEGIRGQAFELGSGEEFRSRSNDFKRTLMALGKTISAATR